MTTPSAYDENDLLQQIAKGNKEGFETIYNQHFISVFYFARRFVTDTPVAEDITMEVFMKLWEKLKSFESLQAIKSFLYVAAKNACLNHLRNEQRKISNQKQLSYLLSAETDGSVSEQNITARVYQHIYDEIENLPEQLKKVFKMAYFDGLSNEDIAQKLAINNQSVRNHKSRALRSLRMVLIDRDILESLLLLVFLDAALK